RLPARAAHRRAVHRGHRGGRHRLLRETRARLEGTLTEPRVVGLRCRIAEPASYAPGIEPLARALGQRLGVEPRLIGEPPPGWERPERWDEPLAPGGACLLAAAR